MEISLFSELIIVIIADIIGLSLASGLAYIGYRLHKLGWKEYTIFFSAWILFAISRLIEVVYLATLAASYLAGEIYFLDPFNPRYTYWWLSISVLDLLCFSTLLFYQKYGGKYVTMIALPILAKLTIDAFTAIAIFLIVISQLIIGEKPRLSTYLGYFLLAISYIAFSLNSIMFLNNLMLIASLSRLIGLLLLFYVMWRVE